jgi:hypothetical protein
MNMKKSQFLRYFMLLFLWFVHLLPLKAQYIEGGIFLGGSNYIGDLSGTFMNFGATRPAGGVITRYHINDRFTLRGFAAYGTIWGADSLSSRQAHNARNLSFFSHVIEFSTGIEYNFIKFSYKRYAPRPFVPFVFASIGVFNYNPKTNYDGKVYELQPRGTEGQQTTEYNEKRKYDLTQFCIPFGFGVKKRLTDRLTLGIELGARYTFSNYLDDVGGTYANRNVVERFYGVEAGALSDRSGERNVQIVNGEPVQVPLFASGDRRSIKRFDINDFYFFSGITLTYRLKKSTQCPKF